MPLKNKTYDILKWIALIAMDAIGVFYATVADIWGLPYGDAVCKTCAAIALLIGALIGVSTAEYRGRIAKNNEESYVNAMRELNGLRQQVFPDDEDLDGQEFIAPEDAADIPDEEDN